MNLSYFLHVQRTPLGKTIPGQVTMCSLAMAAFLADLLMWST